MYRGGMTESIATHQIGALSEGVVYCCAQPTVVPCVFQWTTLDAVAKASCSKILQRVAARIETTAFGEKFKFEDDTRTVSLLCVVGVDRTIFAAGCMTDELASDAGVAVELDRCLLQMQRAYSQHIAGFIGVGASGRIEGRSAAGDRAAQQQQRRDTAATAAAAAAAAAAFDVDGGGSASTTAAASSVVSQHAVEAFADAVRVIIDSSSQRIADIYGVRAFVRGSQLARAGAGARATTTAGGSRPHASTGAVSDRGAAILAQYAAGAGGALEEPFLDDVNDPDELRLIGRDDDGDSDGQSCCGTRVRFVMCFLFLFTGAAVLFVYMMGYLHRH